MKGSGNARETTGTQGKLSKAKVGAITAPVLALALKASGATVDLGIAEHTGLAALRSTTYLARVRYPETARAVTFGGVGLSVDYRSRRLPYTRMNRGLKSSSNTQRSSETPERAR